ncbi:DsbA family protein [Streptomyces sp. NPDC051162]|uniref:DsbA family oxidoreductase n=1 Tax=unclassified Streptomyces TaxID=2593676 RepID=UPI00343EC1B2
MVKADMVLDVICVHSYIGFTRLRRAAGRLRAAGREVELTFRPYELAPAAPNVAQPLVPVLQRLFGPYAETQIARTTGQAAREGLELDYDRAVVGNTFAAHLLIARAQAQGRAEAMVERLFRAHFTDGLYIGDPGVLRSLAEECGLETAGSTSGPDGFLRRFPGGGTTPYEEPDAEALREELDRMRRHGVTGVPLFRIRDRVLCGPQTERALYEALSGAPARTAGTPAPVGAVC